MIEITGLKQLKLIESEKMKAVLDSVFRILGIKDYNLISSENDYLFISIVYKEIHKDRIIDSIYRCFEFLDKISINKLKCFNYSVPSRKVLIFSVEKNTK